MANSIVQTTANTTATRSGTGELRREIGLFGGVNVLTGIMVGSGIFYLGSYVLMRSGMSMGLALLVWVIGGGITMLNGLCYAELGAMMPKAGGSYIYQREAYGKGTAFVGGLSSFILGSCGSTAGLAMALSGAISTFVPLSDLQIRLIAVAAVVLLTIANIYGVKQGSLIQNIFTVGKLIPIALILFAGIFLGTQSPDLTTAPVSTSGEPTSLTAIFGMIAFAAVSTFWAYEGWGNLNGIGEEIKNPKKNIPRAIIISIGFVTVLYTLFNYALYKVIPFERVSTLISEENYYLGTEAAGILFGSVGAVLIAVCMVVSIFGSLNGCVLVFPRSALAMARDGMFPKSLSSVHDSYGTPHIALIAHMVISVMLIFTRDLGQLTALVTFSGMIFNILTFYSVIVLRKKRPDLERPYRAHTWMVYATIAITVGLLINTAVSDTQTSLISVGVIALSYVVYRVLNRRNGSVDVK